MSQGDKKHTPGFQPVLVSLDAFDQLKQLQKSTYGHQDDPNGVRFDLKDIASSVILEAMRVKGLKARALDRTARGVIDSFKSRSLYSIKEKTP